MYCINVHKISTRNLYEMVRNPSSDHDPQDEIHCLKT